MARLTASADDPDVADPASLRVLLDIPMHTHSTDGPVRDGGSHNGGALLFAPDGMLLVSVGDGWNPAPGDGPQDLGLLIGKVLRIHKDGGIPDYNPFVGVPGARPEIWALGFRNPYTMSVHPDSGRLFVNDVAGGKQTVHELVRGGNYQHPFAGPAGIPQAPFHTGQGLIAGGAWYSDGPFPEQYHGSYFITDWRAHAIRRMLSERDPEVTEFATGTRHAVQTRIGPDGALYWLSTTYETLEGAVHRIHFRPETPVAAAPRIAPAGGSFDEPVEVRLAASSPGAVVRYTLDGTEPTASSPRHDAPLVLRHSTRLKARAFAKHAHPSATVSARFELARPASTPSGLELASHWPLDDSAGSLARDISGNGRHGRGQQVTWRSIPGENALRFDGRQSRVDTGAWDLDAPAFTLSAWIRPESFPVGNADFRVLAKAVGEAEADHYWMLGTFRAGQELRLRFRLMTRGRTATLIASTGPVPVDSWSHVAATYDGQAMRLYLNGAEVGALPKSGEPDGNPDVPVWLGANPQTTPFRSFHGALREVRVDRRALSADGLQDLRRESAPGSDPAAALAQQEKQRQFAPALTLAGNLMTGREIFLERCQSCHTPREPGAPLLGPDLASYADRPMEWWLNAILNPNRDRAPEYWIYRAEMADGDTFEGLLVEDAPRSVTLRPLGGAPKTLRRDALRRFERRPQSSMPEGLEGGLSPAQMAGLLAFLRSGEPKKDR